MTIWDTYPASYRHAEVENILSAVRAGECVALVGLSGSGKSNLLGFLAYKQPIEGCRMLLVDCNRLSEPTPDGLFRLVRDALGEDLAPAAEAERLGGGNVTDTMFLCGGLI